MLINQKVSETPTKANAKPCW